MTRLRRIRLDGIGPTGARFDPVTIDLTNRDGEAAKVALIHLENGGGKSVLLKLVFSAVLPGRRYTVGGAKLGDFVLGDDTGHVALEWGIDDGGGGEALLVTGTVLEWRNRTRSADQSNLRQWWYAFRPIPGVLELDLLPTRLNGRRPSRAAFRDRLIDTWHTSPALELADEDGPERWRDWLLNHTPLDPELFAYQRAMNADESDAEELFSNIRTSDDFVRMLLRAVADPLEMQSFGDTVAAFAVQLARREGLERERTFTVDAVSALELLSGAHISTVRAAESIAAARRDRWALQARLAAEVDRATGEAQRLSLAAESDETVAKQLDERAGQLVAQGQELRRLEALFMVAEANERLEESKRRAEVAATTAHAWKVVETVIDQATAAADRVRLERELEEADRQDAPFAPPTTNRPQHLQRGSTPKSPLRPPMPSNSSSPQNRPNGIVRLQMSDEGRQKATHLSSVRTQRPTRVGLSTSTAPGQLWSPWRSWATARTRRPARSDGPSWPSRLKRTWNSGIDAELRFAPVVAPLPPRMTRT